MGVTHQPQALNIDMQSNTVLTTPSIRITRATRMARASLGLRLVCAAIAAMMLLPLAYLVLRGLDVGLERALELLLRPRTFWILANSSALAVIVTAISFLLALPLAWLTVCTDLPGRRTWSILVTLPLVIPSYVGAFALVAFMGPRGIVQGWLEPLGVDRLPSIYGLPGAAWTLTLFTYPYLLLSIRAGLRGLDPALTEAARGLGYTAWRAFWRVTLPALRPAIAAGALLVSLYVLSDFGVVSILRFNSFTRAIYVSYMSSFDRNLASLLSLLLVLLTLLLLFAAQRFQGRRRYDRAGVGAARVARLVELGRWRWPALLFCAAVVVSALVIPTAIVVFWLLRGIVAGQSLAPMWLATANSLRAASLASGAIILLAMPVSYLAVRHPSRFSMIVSRSVYIGYGLPGIVVALSLVFFGANYATFLYQTVAMLIFAYVVRFLPQAFGTVRANLLQISPRLEEAARGLGLNRGQTLWRVTLPLVRPGIWAGAALVFLSTMKELPATLLLSPSGFTTLATQIWSATDEAFYARAAAPALLLLGVSALSISLILGQEERSAA